MDKLIHNKAGFSTVEILVAMVIMILSVTATITLVFGSQSIIMDSETSSEALSIAQELIENAQADAKKDFALVNPKAGVLQDIIYTKSLKVETLPDFFTKKVTSVVNWKGDRGKDLKVELTTLVIDLEGVNGGTTCNSVLSGDWSNPQLMGDVDVGENNGATDVDVLLGKAYVTTDSAADIKHDFYVINISNPNLSPLPILGSTDASEDLTDPSNGVEAVHAAGDYAYVANRSINGQLQIIDISDPTNPAPILTGQGFEIPGVTGPGIYGKSIFYKDGYIYLGLYNTATGPEFNIIDVTNPLIPVWKGGYSIGHDINAIYVRDEFAYIASPHDSELIILDVGNPNSPTLEGEIDLFNDSSNGRSIAIVGDTLYLGRTEDASPPTDEFQLIDITDKSAPVSGTSKDIGSSINAITIREDLAFMVTGDTNLEFQIWDLNTMLLYGSKDIQQTSTGAMDCEGNYIYIGQRSQQALQIVGPGP